MMTRKEREKQKQRRERNREWKENLPEPISNVINFTLKPGDRVYTLGRVSTPEQEQSGDLDDQIAFLRYQVEVAGADVVGSTEHVGSGQETEWLERAYKEARRLRADYVLVESVDRLVRSPQYSKTNQSAQASNEDVRRAQKHACGMPTMSYLDPDATCWEVRKHQTQRGERFKKTDRKPGYKIRIREQFQYRANKLHRQGMGLRRIARIVSYEAACPVNYTTIRTWVKQQ